VLYLVLGSGLRVVYFSWYLSPGIIEVFSFLPVMDCSVLCMYVVSHFWDSCHVVVKFWFLCFVEELV
jgi:hypothetical protein